MSKATAYSLSSTLAAVLAGALLGVGGARLPVEVRITVATLLAGAALVVGSLELGGRLVRVLQCDRETPQRWLHRGAWRWAMRNGSALGLGWSSRIGFWLWYVVPAAAVLSGSPLLGAAVWGIILGPARRLGGNDAFATWSLRRMGAARKLASATLVAVGAATMVAVGV